MVRIAPIALVLILGLSMSVDAADSNTAFDTHFTADTLRLDLSHFVTREIDRMSLDRVHLQGAWAGPRRIHAKRSPLGSYRLDLHDASTGVLLFSRGWDSIAAEYRATQDARAGIPRTFQETVLVPAPRNLAVISVHRIEADGDIRILEHTIDPAALTIGRSLPPNSVIVVESRISGPPATTLDLLFLGEGYTADETAVFSRDLERFATLLLNHEPLASLAHRISIRGALQPSEETGCDEPTRGRWVSTVIGASFNALGSPRYLLTEQEWTLRDIASAAPYDALVIMVNHDRYGGGGLYNTWCTFTAGGAWSDYLLLHEFGHSFAGLADEYYTSSVAYEDLLPPGVEPRAPNITALLDPDTLKWRHLVSEGIPLPTPWPKAEYDRRDLEYQARRRQLDSDAAAATRQGDSDAATEYRRRLADLTKTHVSAMKAFLAEAPHAQGIGAFEGGGYASTGLYRPAQDCLMFTRGVQPWCAVCRAAVEKTVVSYLE